MTDQEQYDKAAELAMGVVNAIKGEQAHKLICKSMWMALALLYSEMVKREEINSLKEIGKDKALLYWTEACVARPEASKIKRIWIAQALYLYDLIAVKEHG